MRVRNRKDAGHRGFTISYVKSGNRKKVASGEVKVAGREPGGALVLEGGRHAHNDPQVDMEGGGARRTALWHDNAA